jgi:hypothetical protein
MVKKSIKDLHRSVKKTKTLGGGGGVKDIFKSESTFGRTGTEEVTPVLASGTKGSTLHSHLVDYFLTLENENGWHHVEVRDYLWMIETLKYFSTIGSTDTCGNSIVARMTGKLEQNIVCENNKTYSYLLLYNIANYYFTISPNRDDKTVFENLKTIFKTKLDKHVAKLPTDKEKKSSSITEANTFLETANIPEKHVDAFKKVAMYLPQQPSGGKKTRKRRKNRRKTKRVKKYYK